MCVCACVGMRVIQNDFRGKMVKEVARKVGRSSATMSYSPSPSHPSPCSEFVEIYRNR